jgi:hypothetical protein
MSDIYTPTQSISHGAGLLPLTAHLIFFVFFQVNVHLLSTRLQPFECALARQPVAAPYVSDQYPENGRYNVVAPP